MSESDSDFSDSDSEILHNQVQHTPPVKKWDQFREVPPAVDTGSAVKNIWWIRGEMFVKLMAYIFAFCFVIISSVVAKGTMIFMIKQISTTSKNIPFCNSRDNGAQYIDDPLQKQYEVDFSCLPSDLDCQVSRVTERVAWIWAIAFAFCVPQAFSFGRSLRKFLFKFTKLPSFLDFMFVLFMELCQTVGLAVLCYLVLPEMDSVSAIILTSSLALVPSLLLMLSRFQEDNDRTSRISWLKLLIDIPVVVIQLSGAVLWPLIQYMGWGTALFPNHPYPWAVPVGVVLTSCGWWETFTEEDSSTALGKMLWRIKRRMIDKGGCRYATYFMISPLKIATFLGAMVVITWQTGAINQPSDLVDYFDASWNDHTYQVAEVVGDTLPDGDFDSGFVTLLHVKIDDPSRHALWVLLIQIFTALFAYVSAKFASKVWIQTLGFALPITCVTPACLGIVLSMCGARSTDKCSFENDSFYIPNRLFFECPALGSLIFYSWESDIWLFLIWFISYIWISIHVWYPKSPRLASTEQIFGTPFYDGIFIDQSLMLNRRNDGLQVLKAEDIVFKEEEELGFDKAEYLSFPEKSTSGSNSKSSVKASDSVTEIYACATMWHESEEEMMEMLKSLYRIDSDYSARRLSQKYLGVVDPDYYEWETHILFDDCMEVGGTENEQVCNKFVLQLVDMMDEAGSRHFGKKIRVKPCKKYPTPYGGRLVWTLPGKTKIVCHLKDKAKIRHKKRWSQIMYMYYLLGYKLMELPISDERKEVMAENTYLLALDGDVDFQPDAAIRLVDLMKKNKGVGAACGRIHPTGSGYMPMYQTFEYAVGHWLQKATEHVLGSVLCSPGCFSLFRGKAIMDDNVMRKYTTVAKQARQHIQFDQGEDRWLCTLLLQRGWRVEYSAASDSYTACPEGFDEFYNQRRRWMPSTMLNILDLLSNWKSVTEQNEDVSRLYIAYQMGIMVGTFIGPGGIYMMIAGSMSKVFQMDPLNALLYNAIPIFLFCLACYYTNTKFQLAMAKLLTLGYTMLMLAVYVGLTVQIGVEGFLSPTALSAASFFLPLLLAGILHMEEAYYMPYMVVYLVTIPSMYILLVIYSLFNLWNVSWGTREVKEKKTAAEMAADKREAEEIVAMEAKRTKEGMMGTLMGQFKFGQSGSKATETSETGSIDFSLGNVLRCMCFTHEDPHEPKKQLVNIATSLQKVSDRLSRIEGSTGGSMQTSRRRSSIGIRSGSRKSIGAIQEEGGGEGSSIHESMNGSEVYEDEVEEYAGDQKTKRDDDTNPYWIDDEALRNGPVDYLSGTEINFWREMIDKYLQPLNISKKEAAKGKQDLYDYRDSFIFTFLMINMLYVVLVSLLQLQSNIKIPWTVFESFNLNGADGLVYMFTYEKPMSIAGIPKLTIGRECKMLDVLGLCFLATFSSITFAQVVGMVMHRWQTYCQYVASTRLKFFEKSEGNSAIEDMNRVALDITRANQVPEEEETNEQKKKGGLAERRQTVSARTSYHKKVGGHGGEEVNLERQFKIRFANMDLENQKDPMMRRLSVRRDTMHHLAVRRDSFIQRRRSSVGVGFDLPKQTSFSSSGYDNNGFDEEDSMFDDDDYSGSGYDGRGRNSVQFEVTSRV